MGVMGTDTWGQTALFYFFYFFVAGQQNLVLKCVCVKKSERAVEERAC